MKLRILIPCLAFVSATLVVPSSSENILFAHPVSTYSHRISVWPLVKKLVANGHQITFISPYPNKNPLPNVTEINPEPVSSFVQTYILGDLDISKRVDNTMGLMVDNGPVAGKISCKLFLESPDILKWLDTNPSYDLVVIDWFFSECALGLAYKFQSKIIFYASAVMIPGFYELFGIVPDSASVPEFEFNFASEMTLWERTLNTLQPLVWRYKNSNYLDTITGYLRENLNLTEMPHVREIAKNASLVLWSEEVTDGYPMSITPNFIRVGGMHCKEKVDPLPKDLSTFVSKSARGFVYISLGSAVTPNNLPLQYQDMFFSMISKFPEIQFIWKWSERTRQDNLTNLYMGDWFPQQEILAHPKLLTFVTQGGKPSVQESICHGAPIVALPVFGDQDVNAERIRDQGAGLVLQLGGLTSTLLENAIQEMISNNKYKTGMQRLSKLFHDRPMKPADTALWWTEYVLRHDDTHHLRSMSINKSWYERRLLDVWGLIAVSILTVTCIMLYATVWLWQAYRRITTTKVKTQ